MNQQALPSRTARLAAVGAGSERAFELEGITRSGRRGDRGESLDQASRVPAGAMLTLSF